MCVRSTAFIMNKKDLRKIEMITARENVQNILPSKEKHFFSNKIDKTIEIIIINKQNGATRWNS